MTQPSLEDLLVEIEDSSFHLHSLYEHSDRDLEVWRGSRRWNVRLRCPNGLYAYSTADTPHEALRIAIDSGKELSLWKPTRAQVPRTNSDLKTLDDVLAFLPSSQEG